MPSDAPRILVVEDELIDWEFVQDAIVTDLPDAKLHRAKDGGDALIYLASAGAPDLMLLDLGLPQVSGFDLLDWVRERPARRARLVIVLSSSDDPANVDRAFELGADAYFVKPLERKSFQTLVRGLAHAAADPSTPADVRSILPSAHRRPMVRPPHRT